MTPSFAARAALLCCAGLATASLAACSANQAYGAGQSWQRNECNKLNDAQERTRCMASANTSYEEYKRKADAAAGSK